jgi:hypothetical protein
MATPADKLAASLAVLKSLRAADLAGYRNGPVYIRRSMHTPPNIEAVRELMPTLFELLQQEAEASVRVVLGHFTLCELSCRVGEKRCRNIGTTKAKQQKDQSKLK